VRLFTLAIATALVLAQALAAARAQSPEPAEPATLVRDALASPYGKTLIAERIKLASVSPAATGNAALSKPADDAEENLDKFIAANKSAAVKRYLALAEQDAAARKAAFPKDPPQQPVPVMFYQGVETDLEGLCISRR
jgi:hypothetical protein